MSLLGHLMFNAAVMAASPTDVVATFARDTTAFRAPSIKSPECARYRAASEVVVTVEADGWWGTPQADGSVCWLPPGAAVLRGKRGGDPLKDLLFPAAKMAAPVALKFGLQLLKQPTADAEQEALLARDEAVTVVERKGDYVLVRRGNGSTGWVRLSGLEDVPAAVLKEEGLAFVQPGTGRASTIKAGTLVSRVDTLGDWSKVVLEDGSVRFLKHTLLVLVNQFKPVTSVEARGVPVLLDATGGVSVAMRATLRAREGSFRADTWLSTIDGVLIPPGAQLKDGERYLVHVVCNQDCFVRLRSHTSATGEACDISPRAEPGQDTAPIVRGGDDFWSVAFPAGTALKVQPPLMSKETLIVEVTPASNQAPPKATTAVCATSQQPPVMGNSTLAYAHRFISTPRLVLFTPEEVAEGTKKGFLPSPPSEKFDGPDVVVNTPKAAGSYRTPLDVSVSFKSRGIPVDPRSLKVRGWLGQVSKDITALVLPYSREDGLDVSGVDGPAGQYNFELHILDIKGNETVRVFPARVAKP